MKTLSKRMMSKILVAIGTDALFRHLNSNKLLVVMYHGITQNSYDPPVWTHLPVNKFRQHLAFLKQHYSIVSLEQVLSAVNGKGKLPCNAALITFDDGYSNNCKVALPILKDFEIPATIFVTVDKIGSDSPLWFDDVYLLLHSQNMHQCTFRFVNDIARDLFNAGRTWEAYGVTVEVLKKCSEDDRASYIKHLRKARQSCDDNRREDFCLLGWDELFRMRDSGLISFGVHTASHRILSGLVKDEWEQEIKEPRKKLEKLLGTPVTTFCFPNGRPGIDFYDEHISYMRDCGYCCSFTTESVLFSLGDKNCMKIGRIPAGNDITSDSNYFKLNCSGFIPFIHNLIAGD